jgi:hypothetical protein
MILQIISTIFSILGYYFLAKNPIYSYTSFILLNITLLLSGFQLALIVNTLFAGYFLIKLIRK